MKSLTHIDTGITVRAIRQHGGWYQIWLVLFAFGSLVVGVSSGAGLPTTPLIDINPGVAGSFPRQFTTVNNTVFFVAINNQTGQELWKTDGTPQGTSLVKDINPGPADATPARLTSVGDKLFFFADNGSTGMELWVSDGTSAGTVLVKEIAPGPAGIDDINFVPQPVDLNGVFIFGVKVEDYSLWRSDGTAVGTTLVKDLNYPGFGSANKYMAKLGNTIFFTASDGTPYSDGLWKTDGTPAGTMVVKYLQLIDELQPVGNTLFFNGGLNDGSSLTSQELWKSDGTPAGTVEVKDINVGNQGSQISEMTAFNGQLFFQATGGDQTVNPSTATGHELWKSDGTMDGTVLVKDIAPGFADSQPRNLTPVGDTLYFAALGELWKSDGTMDGTVLVKDISTGFSIDPAYPHNLVNIDGQLLFWANDGIHGREPWVSDGTVGCTTLIHDVTPGPSSTGFSTFEYVDVGTHLLFNADDGSLGTELWAINRIVDAQVQLPTMISARPRSIISLPIQYNNNGLRPASNVIIRATLDPDLIYRGDSSGITPTIDGQTVQWNIPDIKLRCGSQFSLQVETPAGALNTTYSLSLTITTTGPEADGADNSAETIVILKELVYLPFVQF